MRRIENLLLLHEQRTLPSDIGGSVIGLKRSRTAGSKAT
jgi:hypothetical protein